MQNNTVKPESREPSAKRRFAPVTLFSRIKTWMTIGAIACGIALLIGGCVRIDYKVFKSKYPSAGIGSYIWHKMSK